MSLILGFLFSSWAFGFSLEDHKSIMLQAIQEVNECSPKTISFYESRELVAFDLDEDLNIFRKGLLFSHYYNPEKKLTDLYRFDSLARVKMLEVQLSVDSTLIGSALDRGPIEDIGNLIHHLQDMAAPPHVVPLIHGASDGFEQHTPIDSDISSGLSCAEIKSAATNLTYEQIHHETAVKTLERVRSTQVPVLWKRLGFADIRGYLPTTSFWWISPKQEFGKYGFLGDHYGESQINLESGQYEIPQAFYQNYKIEQMKLAVRSSVQALSIYYFKK